MINYYKNFNILDKLISFVDLLNEKFNKKTSIKTEDDLIKYFKKWKRHFDDSADKYYKKMLKVIKEVENDKGKTNESMCFDEKIIPEKFDKKDIEFIKNNLYILLCEF